MLGLGLDENTVRDAVVIALTYREARRLRSIIKAEADADVELLMDVSAGRESASFAAEALDRLKVCAHIERQLRG